MSDKTGMAPIRDAAATGVLSIDAMGGDLGPEAVVSGLALAVKKIPAIRFIVHGDKPTLDA